MSSSEAVLANPYRAGVVHFCLYNKNFSTWTQCHSFDYLVFFNDKMNA